MDTNTAKHSEFANPLKLDHHTQGLANLAATITYKIYMLTWTIENSQLYRKEVSVTTQTIEFEYCFSKSKGYRLVNMEIS